MVVAFALLAALVFGSSVGLLAAKCGDATINAPQQLHASGRAKYSRHDNELADSARLTRHSTADKADDVFDL